MVVGVGLGCQITVWFPPPQEFAVPRGGPLAGEQPDAVDDEDVSHRGGVLLDERLRRCEEEDPTAPLPEDLRDHYRGDDGLAHARRQDHGRRSFEARAGDVHLVRAFLHGPATKEFVRDEHRRRTTRCANNLFRHVGGRRVGRLHNRNPTRATATPRSPAMAATVTKPTVDSPRTAIVIVAEAFASMGPAEYTVATYAP